VRVQQAPSKLRPRGRLQCETCLETVTEVRTRKSRMLWRLAPLKFIVLRVDSRPGWRRPGLFQVCSAKPNTSYKVSFWLKNQGCEISLLIRSEKPKTAPPANRRILGEKETGTNKWRKFEFVYTVPASYYNIRFDLGLLQPGTFWIDDVRIEEMQTD